MSFDKMNEVRSWKCSFLFTGEENCVKQSSGGGAKNRVIAYECNGKVIENGNHTAEFVRNNFGYAGREYINKVRESNVVQLYRDRFNAILDEADTTDKQAGAMALIMTGDEIARELFYPDEKPLEVRDVKEYLCSATEVDVTERAFEYVCNHIAQFPDRFRKANEPNEPTAKVEYWGERIGETVFINKNTLEAIMVKNGFDFDACKKKWAERGYVETYYGRYITKRSYKGQSGYYVGLKPDRLDANDANQDKPKFVEVPNDDLPFTMEGEQTKL
jgi:hypothetical protein